ncbi:putative ABC exporter domain-containing protein [Myxococcus qinghaiensis]|uniref:putative ABC exporter domain-containing protein n=1 Tax=Myxococcus qinghaiensis TaxID=2906758 RepID=UPI0020A7C29F|nr:putative ABC exporter domain-containing protein [Myxococcus qinghaiensis]MCP3169138.1 putative ABC exporter domain-containing protein [Myxococcus qinghaiensis]
MSFSSAVVFLWLASSRNRLRLQLQRLRRPRYLVGALVGLGYIYSIFLRRLEFGGALSSVPPGVRLFAELSLVLSALVTVFSAWALGPDRPSLTFTETEVVQLFPAPVTRSSLLHYKLARGILGAAVGALFASLFVGRLVSPAPGLFFLGAFLSLGTLYLHATAASFMRTRWAEAWGTRGLVARWAVLGCVLAAVGLAAYAALEAHPFPRTLSIPGVLRNWVQAVVASPGLSAVLWPARLLVAPALAQDSSAFLSAVPPVLGLALAHYVWVRLAEVPFEESAVTQAETRTRERSQRASGGVAKGRALSSRKAPFRLSARGRPEVALIWKNLITRRRMAGGVASVLASLLLGCAIVAMMGESRFFTDTRRVLGPLGVSLAAMMAVVGPSVFRMDLRMDLPKLDLLRALPLAGWQVVGAELTASALMVGLLQLGLLAVGLLSGPGAEDPWLLTWWWPGGVALAVLLPSVSLAGLFVQNAAVVLFPAWVPADRTGSARGIEALGQRLLTLMGSLVVSLVGLLRAALAGAVVGFPLWSSLDVWALPLGAAAASAVLAGEVVLGVLLLGRAFEHLDVSEDRPE